MVAAIGFKSYTRQIVQNNTKQITEPSSYLFCCAVPHRNHMTHLQEVGHYSTPHKSKPKESYPAGCENVCTSEGGTGTEDCQGIEIDSNSSSET